MTGVRLKCTVDSAIGMAIADFRGLSGEEAIRTIGIQNQRWRVEIVDVLAHASRQGTVRQLEWIHRQRAKYRRQVEAGLSFPNRSRRSTQRTRQKRLTIAGYEYANQCLQRSEGRNNARRQTESMRVAR